MPWFVYAFGAALVWGLHYNFLHKAGQVLSPISLFLLPIPLVIIGIPLYYHKVIADWHALLASEQTIQLSAAAAMWTGLFGTMMIYKAMTIAPNPTLVGLIEMTYPAAIVVFAYLIFGENHLTPSVGVGSLFMFVGAGLIIYNS